MPAAPTPLVDRFWRNVRKTDSCWLWTAAKTFGGYGVIRLSGSDGKLIRAHRLSWELVNGPIPDKMRACHTCDNPQCVNPDHLFLGTQVDNMHDCSVKGRARGGAPRGARHPQAKLDDNRVRTIRQEYAAGGVSLNNLAARYNVSKKSILNIVRRRVWTHV